MRFSFTMVLCAACLLSEPAAASPLDAPSTSQASMASCPPGFAVLSGTRTCVKVSGRVRSEFVTSRAGGVQRSEGRVGLDARTMTEYGPLRTVIRVEGRTK